MSVEIVSTALFILNMSAGALMISLAVERTFDDNPNAYVGISYIINLCQLFYLLFFVIAFSETDE